MKGFLPKTGAEAEWTAARSRLEDYLRALRLADAEQRDRIVLRLLERAADKHAEHPELCPTALAMAEIRAGLDRRLAQNLLCQDGPAPSASVAWFALATPEIWAAAFLEQYPPAGFERAWLADNVCAAPESRISSMVPQPFANPLHGTLHLPAAIGKVARELPRRIAKATAAMRSAVSILSGARLR